jgi:uncharacterized protein YbjT (DUF2867 family)
MQVAIAGAHGQVGIRLARLLVDRGDAVIGVIRTPGHTGELRGAGVNPVICDLEHATIDQIAAAVGGSDAVVFAAGAGPGSGAARKLTMDRDGAIKLLDATAVDSSHYVMLSGMGVDDPPAGDDVFSVYLRAKAEADAAVTASDRDWTIVRPGGLTDESGTDRVQGVTFSMSTVVLTRSTGRSRLHSNGPRNRPVHPWSLEWRNKCPRPQRSRSTSMLKPMW